MIDPIFPPKENSEMSDRDWETYCCQVWCNNSLNAVEGFLRREEETPRIYELGACRVILDGATIANIADQLRKAQMVINFLLKDSGRTHHMTKEIMQNIGYYTICFYADMFGIRPNGNEGFDNIVWINVPTDIFDKWFDSEELDVSKEEWFKTYTADNTVGLAQYIQGLWAEKPTS